MYFIVFAGSPLSSMSKKKIEIFSFGIPTIFEIQLSSSPMITFALSYIFIFN